jgi:hypothetical protein
VRSVDGGGKVKRILVIGNHWMSKFADAAQKLGLCVVTD